MTLPIRVRLTLWYLAVLLAILLGLSTYLAVSLRAALIQGVDDSLAVRTEAIVRDLEGPEEGEFRGGDLSILPELRTHAVVAQLLTLDGRVVQATGEIEDRPLVGREALVRAQRGSWRTTLSLPGRRYARRVLVLSLPGLPSRDPLFLAVSQSLEPVDRTVDRLVLLLAAAAPVALGVAALGGWGLARAALRPVDVMTRTAAAIEASGPPEFIPVPRRDDELARLARTLNIMLERLRRALEAERRFTADASHELRNPLGIMKGELDVALRSPKTPDGAREILGSVREEVASISRIVDNLLVLSRAEALGRVELSRRRVDLLELARTVEGRFQNLAERRGVNLRVEGAPIEAWVDPDLITQVLSNIVDNALRYTDSGGCVKIAVHGATTPRIEISDTGVGISPEALPRIFDRFYRVDPARGRSSGGAGLGLAIARRLVEGHGGRIEVRSEPGRGTTFAVHLPMPA